MRSPVPGEVRRSLSLRRGERVLAASCDDGGRWVVATDRAIHLPESRPPEPGSPGTSYRRVPWEEVERGEWDRDAEVLRMVETAEFGAPRPASSYALAGGRGSRERLLTVIRERVTASVVLATHVPLRGELGVRVVARRVPGQDTEMAWSVVFDEGLDPDAPEVLEAAGRALEEARSQVET